MKKLIAAALTLVAISTAHASNGGSPINYSTYPYLTVIERVPRGWSIGSFCLATVSGKNSAITAAHCLTDLEKFESKNVYAYIDSMLKPFKIKRVSVNNKYEDLGSPYDTGVLYTARYLSIRSLAVNTDFDAYAYLNAQPGKEMLFTYFGLDAASVIEGHIRIMTGTLSVMSGPKCSVQIQDLLDHEGDKLNADDKKGLQEDSTYLKRYPDVFFCVFNKKTDTIEGTPGDSGGPLIFNVGGQDYLVGNLIVGYDVRVTQRYSRILLFTNIKYSSSFIASCIHEELRQAARLSVTESRYMDVNKNKDFVDSNDAAAQCPKSVVDVPTPAINYLLLN